MYSLMQESENRDSHKTSAKSSAALAKEEYKKLFKSLWNKVYLITDKRCHKVLRLARKSIRGELLSSTCLGEKIKSKERDPFENSILSNQNFVPKQVILHKRNIYTKRAINRQKILNEIWNCVNNKDQLQKIFKLGSNLSDLRYKNSNRNLTKTITLTKFQ